MAALDGRARDQEADRYVEADGSVRWMRWHTKPLRDGSDIIIGLLLTGEDMTARMQMERDSEAESRDIRFSRRGHGQSNAGRPFDAY